MKTLAVGGRYHSGAKEIIVVVHVGDDSIAVRVDCDDVTFEGMRAAKAVAKRIVETFNAPPKRRRRS